MREEVEQDKSCTVIALCLPTTPRLGVLLSRARRVNRHSPQLEEEAAILADALETRENVVVNVELETTDRIAWQSKGK